VKRTGTALLVLALFAAVPAAAESRVERSLLFRSEALGRPLAYSLYLPDGYGANGRRHPVLYLLHGVGGGENDWLDMGRLRQTADWMVALGEIPPLVIVMPGGDDGWYVDNPDPGGAGAMATAIGEELVAHVDATLATDARREARAIAGVSMGGYGALRLALLHPETFTAAASLSGALFAGDEAMDGPFPELFHGAFGRPLDRKRLVAASPVALIGQAASAATPPALFITCGDDDELGFANLAARFHERLRGADLAAELRITDGNHSWQLWEEQLPSVLRFLGQHLEPR
jgi:enterochelin esterase family protein